MYDMWGTVRQKTMDFFGIYVSSLSAPHSFHKGTAPGPFLGRNNAELSDYKSSDSKFY